VESHARLPDLGRRYPSYVFVPGVEVSTREGHLLVYGVSERPPVRAPLEETIDWVRARGGVSVLAHPLRWAHGVGRRRLASAKVDGVEVLNGHNGPVSNARAELIGARRGLTLTGGSDAHDLAGIGRTYTRVMVPELSVEAVLKALRSGHTEGGGRSLALPERARLAVLTAARRAARGFRPI
jgi:PHP-associated